MFRVSNGVITLVNVLTLVVSLCAVSASLWMYVKAESPCDRAVRIPLLAVGGALMAVSMVGLLGSCCRVTFFMWLYLITLFLLIVGLTGFTLFAILVTSEGIEQAIKTVGNDEYSAWLQNHAINAHNWDSIKSCMTAANICHVIQGDDMPITFKPHFTPIQLGCCQPPAGCSMKTENSTISKEGDCKAWNRRDLCFECNSCRDAVLHNIKKEWRMLAIFNSCLLVSIIIIYSIGCCALRNNHEHSYKKRRSYHA